MKKSQKNNHKPKIMEWRREDDTTLAPAGYVDFADEPQPVTREKRKELNLLDARLRAIQTVKERLRLYEEIIHRDDLGDGWAIGLTDAMQNDDFNFVELNLLAHREKEAVKKSADIETQIKNAVAPLLERFDEATTPPSKRKKSENIQRLFNKQAGNKSDKWRAVAEIVFKVAMEQSTRKQIERVSDYQTDTKLKHLIKDLTTPGANYAEIKRKLAANFQRYMNQKPTKQKKS